LVAVPVPGLERLTAVVEVDKLGVSDVVVGGVFWHRQQDVVQAARLAGRHGADVVDEPERYFRGRALHRALGHPGAEHVPRVVVPVVPALHPAAVDLLLRPRWLGDVATEDPRVLVVAPFLVAGPMLDPLVEEVRLAGLLDRERKGLPLLVAIAADVELGQFVVVAAPFRLVAGRRGQARVSWALGSGVPSIRWNCLMLMGLGVRPSSTQLSMMAMVSAGRPRRSFWSMLPLE